MDDDPIEVALRPAAVGKPAATELDPIEEALNPASRVARREPIAVPEAPASPSLAGIARGPTDVALGIGETALRGGLDVAGKLTGGAASLAGRFLPSGDWERAQKWADKVQQEVSSAGGLMPEQPITETGKMIGSVLAPVGSALAKAKGFLGQKTLETIGMTPLGAAAASTVDALTELLPQIAGAKLIARIGAGGEAAVKPVPAGAATLAPESGITRAPPAAGQPLIGGTSAPELSEAIKKLAPTVETAASPLPDALDHAPSDLPATAQAQREAVLARVGHQQARTSAVTGNGPATRFDYDQAASPSPAGQMMQKQIDSETAANAGFAGRIQQATGGSAGLDQAARYNRGNVIDAARSALQQWHENQVSSQYASARATLGDTPVQMTELSKIAPDPTKVSGTTQGIAFKDRLDTTMQHLGMLDKDGNVLPTTVNNAERLRQWMNTSWKPETSGFISELKSALDSDVTKAAGQDVFERARTARILQAQQLDTPAFNKIRALSDADNFEAIPDAMARLPSNQLAHVSNVLSNMPEGLQPAGTAALNEIAGHFANRIIEAGTPRAVGGSWSNIGVSEYLANNNQRMAQVFTPNGMQMISDLNQAGKITAMDKRYPGAQGQSQNFLQRGLIYALPKLGGVIGGGIGGLFGGPLAAGGAAMTGEAGGAAVASKMQAEFARRQMQGRIQPLNLPAR